MSTAERKAAALARQKKGGHGAAAATTPSTGFGTATTTSSQGGFGVAAAASTMAGLGTAAADSSPIYGRCFTGDSSHARGGSTGASSVWWDAADGGYPISPTFRRPSSWDRENNSHPPGGFMGILNSQDNLHFVGAPSHYAPFKAPRCANVGGSSPPDVEILSNKKHVVVDGKDENVRTEKRILWTPKQDARTI